MQIRVNGEYTEVKESQTLAQLIEEMELRGKRIAVELNCEIIPRSQFPNVALQRDDCIEIVQAIGGG